VNSDLRTTPVATLDAVRQRATEAVLAQSGLNHPAITAEIRRRFTSTSVEQGTLVQQPVLEAAFPYLAGMETLAQLSGSRLHPALVRALTEDGPHRRYRFPGELKPYEHQLEAWRILGDPIPQSVLVTSGTGSGKTECFLVPLLNDLAGEVDRSGRLSGVRAIALYPLNALIASQQERLREWTAPFGGRIRFGLYNGDMPEDSKIGTAPPEQVGDRRTLRSDPPPILVTNVTMLEYMTVRHQDRPLIEASRGQLRWIILDEAHSYVGSAAAEIALLIRRTLQAFGVTPDQVRFVATSATIGEGEDLVAKLKTFLRDVAGVPDERVHVVVGHRRLPRLPTVRGDGRISNLDLADPDALRQNRWVHDIVSYAAKRPLPWSRFEQTAQDAGTDPGALLTALSERLNGEEPILPLRIHGFIRAVPGLWACLNPACVGKPDGDWPFGAILHHCTDTCSSCGAPALQIISCSDCGEPYLEAIESHGRLRSRSLLEQDDEFAAASEAESLTDEAEESGNDEDAPETTDPYSPPDISRLFAARAWPGGRPLHVEPQTGVVCDGQTPTSVQLTSYDRLAPEACPACGTSARKGAPANTLFRPFRYGAPFLIGNAAPVLLDGVPPRDPDPGASVPPPANGRQLLSFTDSRQGTARFAAALQNSSERNSVRALIYHAVQDSLAVPAIDERLTKKLDEEIRELESVLASAPAIAGLLDAKRKERAALGEPDLNGLSWPRMREALCSRPEVDRWMREIWGPREERFAKNLAEFGEFLLLRELARRPRRANALEPLGLARLRFDAIDRVSEANLPPAFANRGRSIDDWRDFLNILVMVNIRNSFAVRINPADQHWLMRKGFPRNLIGPGGKKSGAIDLAWPQARPAARRAIVVHLLEKGLGLNASQPDQRETINAVLEAAWKALSPILVRPGMGPNYALDFDKAHVAPVVTAFACPVSKRLLDTTFIGISPYGMDGSSRLAGQICERLEMPRHPNPFLLPERGGDAVVKDWLAADGAIAKLRERALWGDIHDRLALGSPYARAAEHSAQQPPARLRRYEDAFKEGRINILNCSTTMEMGVDIGSVSSVMMTNVPPSIANYRQRVGRAGRRGQGLAAALTYCRDTPLDREAFRSPESYLVRRIEAPKVMLDSERIVQRHINAFLLAAWFREVQGLALKTTAGDFFGCPPAVGGVRDANSPASLFCEWAERPSTAQLQSKAIAMLARGSALEGRLDVYAEASRAVKQAETDFASEWNAVQSQAAGMDRDTARKALGLQLKRMCGEYLLGELADRGVLPGHGFPTSVVSFIHKDNPDDILNVPDGDPSRRRGYPTRNLDLAIRDYAPGAEVVVDGLVYRSAGVTLNWKRPAVADAVGEVQSLKWFWSCRQCGTADTSQLRPESCAACGVPFEVGDIQRYLQPGGFTVDMREKPHADIEHVAYVEPEPERVVARNAAWKQFLSPNRGRMRSSHDGLVFYASAGESGAGYAVCLECGRAEAQHGAAAPDAQRPLHEHRPLRFTKADAEGLCPGNGRSFAIQTDLSLGHDIVTDVAEIQPAALISAGASWALASALRAALTRRLGVETGEIGLSVVRKPTPIGGTTHSLYFYDKAAGGAGFTPRLSEMFEDLLRDARAILDCPARCANGCSACVLANDLHAQAETIDRIDALAYVDAELAALAAPADEDMVAPDARLAGDVADELIERTDKAAGDVVIWPGETFDPASLSQPRIKLLLDKLRSGGRRVSLSLDAGTLRSLDAAQRLGLRDAAIRNDLVIGLGSAPQFRNGAFAIAALTEGRIWASRDAKSAQMGEAWGLGVDAPIVAFAGKPPIVTPYELDRLLPRSGTAFIEVGKILDGPSRSLADRFLQLIQPQLEAIGRWRPAALVSITYGDRFVRSPQIALMVVQIASRLAAKLAGPQARPQFHLATEPLPSKDGYPSRLDHDWRVEGDREKVLELLCGSRLDLKLHVGACPHSRRLTLTYQDGSTAEIVLDQGFGFLRAAQSPRFQFQEPAAMQAKRLVATDFTCGANGPTYLVVTGTDAVG